MALRERPKPRPVRRPKPLKTRLVLKELVGGHHTFNAVFAKTSRCFVTGNQTVLLRDVRIGEWKVAEHLWINTGVIEDGMWHGFEENSVVEIVACVVPYLKGRPCDEERPQRTEYTLGEVWGIRPIEICSTPPTPRLDPGSP